ncbi:MAG: Mo-dependent nitrogenase C-terminal domain-containing protein [Elainellaceae cyanobacterium]
MLNSSILSALKKGLQHNLPFSLDVLSPLRQWLNTLEIRSPAQAHLMCQIIPAQCPFEQEIRIGNLIYINIPPLCKLNPLYEEVVSLRFRALCYLAEKCPADACRYC